MDAFHPLTGVQGLGVDKGDADRRVSPKVVVRDFRNRSPAFWPPFLNPRPDDLSLVFE